MPACPNSPIRSTIVTSSSPLAAASACIARGSTSLPCWPARNSVSRRSTRAFGSSASCTMILDTSTWSRKPCNPSTTRSARGCHPCLRYDPLPMCPGWTKDRQDPSGGFERGLTIQDITAYMDANFDRAKGARRRIDRQLMNGEWPILLRIIGKGDGEQRYLSVAEVRTLFVERRLPDRVAERLMSQPVSAPEGGPFRGLGKVALSAVALVGGC